MIVMIERISPHSILFKLTYGLTVTEAGANDAVDGYVTDAAKASGGRYRFSFAIIERVEA